MGVGVVLQRIRPLSLPNLGEPKHRRLRGDIPTLLLGLVSESEAGLERIDAGSQYYLGPFPGLVQHAISFLESQRLFEPFMLKENLDGLIGGGDRHGDRHILGPQPCKDTKRK